jgi:hypothetical protein
MEIARHARLRDIPKDDAKEFGYRRLGQTIANPLSVAHIVTFSGAGEMEDGH